MTGIHFFTTFVELFFYSPITLLKKSNVQVKLKKMKASFKESVKLTLEYLFQGIVVVAPIAITIYFIVWLFSFIDSILPMFLSNFLEDKENFIKSMPGLGFIMVLLLLILIGRSSSTYIMSKFLELLERVLNRTPGVKLIYSSVNDVMKAFTGNKKKFDKPVLVNVDAEDVWRLGFITQSNASIFDLEDHFVVYVPHSYALSGITYVVPAHKVKFIKDKMKSTEAMKFTVSGGVTELEVN